MSAALVSTIVTTLVLAYAAWTALAAARRAQSRRQLLAGLLPAVAFVLLIRLIGAFGGWTDAALWVWLAVMVACVWAAFRAASVWPDLPWSAADPKVARGEMPRLIIGAAFAAAIAGALVLPGLFLG
ncbi:MULTISPECIES: hypothetical protein [Brevibacterium]|uniref:Uncharacterized protein n=1 Tax=Brevibacterium casei TaxID=33889 RepID=A0A7T4DJ19_9MICO|nr:hypothetical protein [Brevibacterium casei]QQB14945.1 hypothetical protein I6H47_02930 [Brevibacterium casei]